MSDTNENNNNNKNSQSIQEESYDSLHPILSLADVINHPTCTERLRQCILAFQQGKRYFHQARPPKQRPTYFCIPDLETNPWYTYDRFDWQKVLNNNYEGIKQELESILNDSNVSFGKIEANVQSGAWKTFYFYNQGTRDNANCDRCPLTTKLLESIPSLMTGCGLGYAYFSILKPGTHISPHCGPANIRLRCHLPLKVPANCSMRVGEEKREWVEGQCMLFDDSFDHEVWHNGDTDRIVLLIDVWHHDLTPFERNAFRVMLPAS